MLHIFSRRRNRRANVPLTSESAPGALRGRVESLERRLLLHGGHSHDNVPDHTGIAPFGGVHGHSDHVVVVPEGQSRFVMGPHHVDPGHPNDGNPDSDDTHYFAETLDEHHFAWLDQDPGTPRIDIFYDFRPESGVANQITVEQQAVAEEALQRWADASLGTLRFVRNTGAARADIINLGTFDFAALGFTNPEAVLGFGGGFFDHTTPAHSITQAFAWLDTEQWDTTIGNGDVPGTFDYFTVMGQEIGHALGLGHTENIPGPDIMDGFYTAEIANYSDNDRIHIQSLYNPLVGGTLTINGRETGDVISVGVSNGVQTVHFNGDSRFNAADVTTIVINGNDGNDSISIGNAISDPSVLNGGGGDDDMDGALGDDQLFGGDGNDVLRGDGGPDVLNGQGGNDEIHGGTGGDHVIGGPDSDILWGGDGDDEVWGDDQGQEAGYGYGGYGYGGNDECHGGEGNDQVHGGPGQDLLVGGPHSDWLFAKDGEADQLVDGGYGDTDRALVDLFDPLSDIEEVYYQ